jgi:hypothetical protein
MPEAIIPDTKLSKHQAKFNKAVAQQKPSKTKPKTSKNNSEIAYGSQPMGKDN